MLGKEARLTLMAVAAIMMTLVVTPRAQPPVTSRDDDPVASAMERIHSAVERRAAIADRVLAASKLLNECIAARKQGERERASARLRQAEEIVNEIRPPERSHLLDELAGAIAMERVALSHGQPAIQPPLSSDARRVSSLLRPALARYSERYNILSRILAEENLPAELLAVALVESGFNPQALSPKGARGIWQLMPATAQRYGLTVDPMNDHRTSPERSTRAAARYLRDLYQQFGDWKLALAAYNAGEDRIQRIIDRTGIRDFDEMARRGMLPLETRNYVPAVIVVWKRMSESNEGSK
jgi:soluble lytic murein transglycosylase-like protein